MIKFKNPGRKVVGETDNRRVRRITEEMRLFSAYRRASKLGNLGYAARMEGVEEAMGHLINYWGSGGPSVADHPFWDNLATAARRVAREADKVRAEAKMERLARDARERGMVADDV